MEVLVVDGLSTDGTCSLIEAYSRRWSHIRLLSNTKRTTAAALNIGLVRARGDVIIRMDAHNTYPASYIPSLVAWLQKSGADNVGGVCLTIPAAPTPVAQAIAVGLAHPFGVGNAYFRIGVREPQWVDTVPFGCYRRDVFDRIGRFDEDFVRNQDDEFNHRLIRHGGRILLVPEIVSYYRARGTLRSLGRMFYQYGYFKPLAARKLGRIFTARQLAPPLFVISLAGLVGAAGFWGPMRWALGALLLAYFAAVVVSAIRGARTHGVRCALALCVVFPTIHLGYGVGFLKGVLDFVLLRRNAGDRLQRLPTSR